MNISFQTRIPFPRSLVYRTYRDQIIDLVSYLPNVRAVELKARREEGGRVYCVSEWHGGGEIPVIARAVLSDAMLSWTEHDVWDEAQFTLDWRIETHVFTKAVHCVGRNSFAAADNSTIIQNQGELVIDPHHLEGVPGFLRGNIAGVVEEFLSHQIEPNLLQMSEGVSRYLAEAEASKS